MPHGTERERKREREVEDLEKMIKCASSVTFVRLESLIERFPALLLADFGLFAATRFDFGLRLQPCFVSLGRLLVGAGGYKAGHDKLKNRIAWREICSMGKTI